MKVKLHISRRECITSLVGLTAAPRIVYPVTPGTSESPEGDLAILSAAAALEWQAIAAYRAGAGSGKLSPPILSAAAGFLKDHEGHAKALNATLQALGAKAVEPRQQYDFGPLPSQSAILALALELEEGAQAAYAALAVNISNRDVLKAAAGILVDESRHVTIIRSVLKLPVFST